MTIQEFAQFQSLVTADESIRINLRLGSQLPVAKGRAGNLNVLGISAKGGLIRFDDDEGDTLFFGVEEIVSIIIKTPKGKKK